MNAAHTRKSSRLRTLSSRAKESDLKAALAGAIVQPVATVPTIKEQPQRKKRRLAAPKPLSSAVPSSPVASQASDSSAHSSEAEGDHLLSDAYGEENDDTDLSDYEDILPAFKAVRADNYDPVERLLNMAYHQEDILSFSEEDPVLSFADDMTNGAEAVCATQFRSFAEPAANESLSIEEHFLNSTFSILDHSNNNTSTFLPPSQSFSHTQFDMLAQPLVASSFDDASTSFEEYVSYEYMTSDSEVEETTSPVATKSLSFLDAKRRPLEYRHHEKLNLALPETVDGPGRPHYKLMTTPLTSQAQHRQNIKNLYKVMNKRSVISGKAYSEMVGTGVGMSELFL
ncbi:hypothetical protein BABINDRAFT_161317 [Babjeviella inositovora NRRL Y-12698]|uniref:Uncharacterized protein n=1 Tax=Babjeviella inositovora NRRL Y-12698 TaxID=984486 RepID=A0A1E3QS87_9ASCO|nr:uncharacterized protein BABINDRAFT_161317 [Babjeviella inositovora NRRL Y-12698]ODQ80364.1 hypothetical protein BABINDRAFT_161317 [Babjeviella inositovora NRRL Y-12698]